MSDSHQEEQAEWDEMPLGPEELPSAVGQLVTIDWSASPQYKPRGVPTIRKVAIVRLYCETNMLVQAVPRDWEEFHMKNQEKELLPLSIIYWDYRGGWTEQIFDQRQQRVMHHSHPTLRFEALDAPLASQ